ncbi:MAG: DUF4838 domain-containing protein, partial [Armatimonadetes bacterium]|nr:DUF4838 domain-containing protein [Armatimonadota bacterium]
MRPANFGLPTIMVASLVLMATAGTAAPVPVPLARAGKALCAVAVAANASAPEQTAARELAEYLHKVTGATFSIGPPPAATTGALIAVGPSAAKFLAPGLDLDKKALGEDGIVLKTVGKNLVLTGAEGASRGTLYAVYDFLERDCGVRWWTPFEETVPHSPDLAVRPPSRVHVSPFVYRETNSQLFNDTMLNSQHLKRTTGLEERRRFAVRCKNNTLAMADIPPGWGGSLRLVDMRQVSAVRMYQEYSHFISVAEFGKTHPEWFCERNGKRQSHASHLAQLCLSNEAMREEFIRRAKAWVDSQPGNNTFVLMHNDNEYYCQCAVCAAVDAAEGSPSGSQMRFMNAVASAIAQHRPGLRDRKSTR